ncbi:MAG: hypothetical protein KAV82_07125 [Phycisphaerae bacterium]|nr:hypothetical protein [Phycisphaerae bacterium]
MGKRKKQIYAGMLLVVGAGMVLDRITSAGNTAPAAVLGASKAANRPGAKVSSKVAPKGEHDQAPTLSPAGFPANLPAGHAEKRDLFRLSAVAQLAVLKAPQTPEHSDNASDSEPEEGPDKAALLIEQFKAQHTLSAVMAGGEFKMAIVDGTPVEVGQLIGQCRLVRISGQVAVFQCLGEEFQLSVETHQLSDEQ